jgi:hypothetical protein
VNAYFTAGCRKGFRVWYSIGQRTISIAKLGFDVKGSSSLFGYPSIGVSKMASRIIIRVLQMLMKPVYRYYWFFHDLYILGCVLFFAYSISIFQSKVPKQHSRQCKSQFDLAVMEEHQRNGQSDLCIQLG